MFEEWQSRTQTKVDKKGGGVGENMTRKEGHMKGRQRWAQRREACLAARAKQHVPGVLESRRRFTATTF